MTITMGTSFSGLDAFAEAAELYGVQLKYTIENNSFLRNRLIKKYPNAIHYEDIKTCDTKETVTIHCGGFPCQDISQANGLGEKAPGIYGERSGLFFHQLRIICNTRPQYVVLENSPTLLIRGMHEVITALSNIGYMCEWTCLEGTFFGFPQKRRRLFIIAYPMRRRRMDLVLQSPETFSLQSTWTPTETFIRVSTSRADGHRNVRAIQRGVGVENFGHWLQALGNTVMLPMAEYIMLCILNHIEKK
jgi:DNA (cytosine-5)-methyltransferase 1